MLLKVVLHDFIVAMSVYTDVRVVEEAEVDDTAEYTTDFGIAGYAMHNVVGLLIIEPLAFIDCGIGGFGGLQVSKIAYNLTCFLNDIAASLFNVSLND